MNLEPWRSLQLRAQVDLDGTVAFAEVAVRAMMGDYGPARERALRDPKYKRRLVMIAADDVSMDLVGVQDHDVMTFAKAIVDDVLESGDW